MVNPSVWKYKNFIKRDPKTKTLHSVQLNKKYNLVYDKRVICGYLMVSAELFEQ